MRILDAVRVYGVVVFVKIVFDQVVFTSGVRHSGRRQGRLLLWMSSIRTTRNGWTSCLRRTLKTALKASGITHPRPGHADLVGGIKYTVLMICEILERFHQLVKPMRVAVLVQ